MSPVYGRAPRRCRSADREHVPDRRTCGRTRPHAHAVRCGSSQFAASHGRPVWMSGNISAQATAKSVMASAKRLIDVRQSCLRSRRIAEISVPAWPMPIHQTKLMMSNAADGHVVAPDPDPLEEQVADRDQQQVQEHERDERGHDPCHRLVAGEHDRADLARHRLERVPRLDHRRRLLVGRRGSVSRFHQCPVVRSAVAGSSSGLGLRSEGRYVVRGRVLRSSSMP